MKLVLSEIASLDIVKHKKAGNKKLILKIAELLESVASSPTEGIGKPEQLKHKKIETWSRKIDSKHRLVYEIHETEIFVLSLWGHYEDK
jgi:toxin YoeB